MQQAILTQYAVNPSYCLKYHDKIEGLRPVSNQVYSSFIVASD